MYGGIGTPVDAGDRRSFSFMGSFQGAGRSPPKGYLRIVQKSCESEPVRYSNGKVK
jgi:hypothetical protein